MVKDRLVCMFGPALALPSICTGAVRSGAGGGRSIAQWLFAWQATQHHDIPLACDAAHHSTNPLLFLIALYSAVAGAHTGSMAPWADLLADGHHGQSDDDVHPGRHTQRKATLHQLIDNSKCCRHKGMEDKGDT